MKEFVCVSQGIEIFRTKSQEKAISFAKKSNDEYFKYIQECADNYERPADNYVELFIEDGNDKLIDLILDEFIHEIDTDTYYRKYENMDIENLKQYFRNKLKED